MSRILCSFLLLLLVIPGKSQDLADRIPADAVGMLKINTPRFFEHVELDEFSRSALGGALVKFLDDSETHDKPVSLADYGIALDRSAYMYAVGTDSVGYTVFLWPLADARQMEKTLLADKKIITGKGYRQYHGMLESEYGTAKLFVWDDHMLTVISTEDVPGYFEDEAIAARYGIENRSYYDFYEEYEGGNDMMLEGVPYDNSDYWDEVYADTVATVVREADSVVWKQEKGFKQADTAVWEEKIMEKPAKKGITEDIDPETYEDDGYIDWYNLYEQETQRDRYIKDSVMAVWATEYAHSLLAGPNAHSILRNPKYVADRNDKAIVSAWIPDFNTLYAFVWPEIFEIGLGSSFKGLQYYGSMRIDVFADKDLRMTSKMEIADNLAPSIRRMYDSKINRKFFRYIHSEDMIGMYGFAANTQAVLEELPAFLADTYGNVIGPYSAEIGLASELISLMLDEKAIAQVIKGDGVFVLNGLEEKEVPFTHYDWDEDYNWIEVDSVKNELVPDFLFMLSSDDRRTYERIMAYLHGKGVVDTDGRVVSINNAKMPFGVYLTHHNGILFVSSSSEKLESIASNRYRGKMLRSQRRMLRRHVGAGLFNVDNLVKEFDNEQLNTLERYISIRKIFGSLGNMEYTLRMRGNTMEHEFISRTPREYTNAIYQLMYLVDYAGDASFIN